MTSDAQRSDTRDQVLTRIRTAQTPPSVDELATSLGLHRNSVRLHANALQQAGLVTQSTRPSGGRGRPLTVYRPTRSGTRAGSRNYALLAEMLVEHLATVDHPEATAREAGRDWGRRIAAGRPADDPADLVPATLAELGFEPDVEAETIELRNCPFRELVDSHQQLVCSLHAGMLEGLVATSSTAVALIPFTAPATCTVQIA